MDKDTVSKQIEKLLTRLLFDKHNIKVDVRPVSKSEHDIGSIPYYRKYLITIYVDPYKYNSVTDRFSKSYYEFMSNMDDKVSEHMKYIGIDSHEVVVQYVIENRKEFDSMMVKMIYDMWDEVEKEYRIESGGDELPELSEVSVGPKGPKYPEMQVFIGFDEKLSLDRNRTLWKVLHEILPISTMFLEIV